MARGQKFSKWMLLLAAGMVLLRAAGRTRLRTGRRMAARPRNSGPVRGRLLLRVAPPFTRIDGVLSVRSGYAGTSENPTYENYHSGVGYIEVVEVVYDPARVGYDTLLDALGGRSTPPTRAASSPTGAAATPPPSSTTARSSGCWPNSPRRAWPRVTSSRSRWSRPSCRRRSSTRPRTTTRSTTANPFRYKMYRAGSGREGFAADLGNADWHFAAKKRGTNR